MIFSQQPGYQSATYASGAIITMHDQVRDSLRFLQGLGNVVSWRASPTAFRECCTSPGNSSRISNEKFKVMHQLGHDASERQPLRLISTNVAVPSPHLQNTLKPLPHDTVQAPHSSADVPPETGHSEPPACWRRRAQEAQAGRPAIIREVSRDTERNLWDVHS